MQIKDLFIYQGDTHRFRLGLTVGGAPFDAAAAQWRFTLRTPGGETFAAGLSQEGGSLIVDFPAAMTAAFDWPCADYDLRASFGGVVKTYLRGKVCVTPAVGKIDAAGDSDGRLHDERVDVAVSAEGMVIAPNPPDALALLSARIDELAAALKAADPLPRLEALAERVGQTQAAAESALEALGSKADAAALAHLAARLDEWADDAANQNTNTRIEGLEKLVREAQAEIQAFGGVAQGLAEIGQLGRRFEDALKELAKLRQQAAALPASPDFSQDIAEIRAALEKKPKREKIHLTQEMWASGGYTWVEAVFSQEYDDPKIHIQIEHLKRLPVSFPNWNISEKTGRSVFVRTNLAKEKIDVDYSVYCFVEEAAQEAETLLEIT